MAVHTARVDLDDDLGSNLNSIKKHFGIRSDAEALRVAIRETYRCITQHPNSRTLEEELKELPLMRALNDKYDKVLRALGEEKK